MEDGENKVAKCGSCGKTREIIAGEVEPGEMPVCECGDIMFPHTPEPEQGEL